MFCFVDDYGVIIIIMKQKIYYKIMVQVKLGPSPSKMLLVLPAQEEEEEEEGRGGRKLFGLINPSFTIGWFNEISLSF